MGEITISQISITVSMVVGIVTGVGILHAQLKKWMSGLFKDEMENIEQKLDDLDAKISRVDEESCKNYLTGEITRIEDGYNLGDVEAERFWEQYEHYVEIGGNSYIKRKVEQLKEAGQL